MNILLISGHGAGDPGASGNGYKEADLTRELVNLIAPKLRKYADVDIYNQSRNAFKDVQAGKFNPGKYGYVLEVHFNAFKKDSGDGKKKGSEIYVTSRETGITVEQKIMKNMNKFFPLRDNDSVFDGVKRENFAVINKCKNLGMSGALLETCFIDDYDDMKEYQANKNEIATGIVNGIVEGFGLKEGSSSNSSKPATKPSTGTSTSTSGYYQKFNDTSIVDGLNSIGVDSSMENRKKIAKANGISNYSGTASQNTKLLDLARQGKLKKAGSTSSSTSTSTTSYYKKFNSTSIVDGLKSIGVDSSMENRKKIAKANGISNYSGTASQNTKLLDLARQGKLKKA